MSKVYRQEQAIDHFVNDSRVLIQGRRLPADRKLTPAEIEQVRQDFLGYSHRHDGVKDLVSRQVGMVPAVVTRWTSGLEIRDPESVARAINDWMERDARARRAAIPDNYIRTRIAENIRAIVYTAHSTGAMAAIVVPSGAGKTMVLEILAQEMAGLVIYCDEDLTPRAFMEALAQALLIPSGGSVLDLKQRIVGKLRGTGRPIFLDEAHRLRPTVYPRIRSIYDLTGCSIIMAGTHEILEHICDEAGGRGQMSSRCVRYNALETIYNAEGQGPNGGAALGKPLFSRQEIEAIFGQMQVRLDRDGLELLWALACLPGHGCLRTARRVVQLVRQKFQDGPITREQLLWALPLLFGQQGRFLSRLADQHAQAMAKVA